MQSTNQPQKFVSPFAQGDSSRTEIPVTSADPARFSQTLGSPPLTGLPPEAGGVPPQLPDFNGAMNQISRGIWWALGGGRFGYDALWAADPLIGGYARGAVLPAALGADTVGMGEWYNNAEDNLTDPDVAGTGWVPGYHYGQTVLAAQVGGTVTLTPAQAAKRTIRVSGALTANLVIVVPAWVYGWEFYNTTTGAFTVSVRTAGGAAVVVPQDGKPCDLRGDGTTVIQAGASIPTASATVPGIQRNATNAETAAGSLANATVTPAGLAFALPTLVPNASTATAGRTRYATNAEAATATATDLALVPANLGQTKQIAWVTGLQAALDARPVTNSAADFTSVATLNAYLYRGSDGTASLRVQNDAKTQSGFFFFGSNGQTTFPNRLTVSAGGIVTPGGIDTGSSRKLKRIVGPLASGRRAVDAWELAEGYFNDDYVGDGRRRAFIIAESVVAASPLAADAEGVEYRGERVASLHIDQLLPIMARALQELSAELDGVRAELRELRGGV